MSERGLEIFAHENDTLTTRPQLSCSGESRSLCYIYCYCVSCQHDNWWNLSISSVEGIVIAVITSAVESCGVGDWVGPVNPDSSVISIVPVYPVHTKIGGICLSPLLKLSPLLRLPVESFAVGDWVALVNPDSSVISVVPVYPFNKIIGGISSVEGIVSTSNHMD